MSIFGSNPSEPKEIVEEIWKKIQDIIFINWD